MSFLIGADGNSTHGDVTAAYFTQKASGIFKSKLEQLGSISDENIKEALKATRDELTNGWEKLVTELNLVGGSALNMVVLFPDVDTGKTRGAFLGAGDFRSIILKKDGK